MHTLHGVESANHSSPKAAAYLRCKQCKQALVLPDARATKFHDRERLSSGTIGRPFIFLKVFRPEDLHWNCDDWLDCSPNSCPGRPRTPSPCRTWLRDHSCLCGGHSLSSRPELLAQLVAMRVAQSADIPLRTLLVGSSNSQCGGPTCVSQSACRSSV